jgi:hypothetical protein
LLVVGIRALLRGRRVPTRAKLAIAGALVWLLSPLDPVPDFIPAFGVLDDLVVLITTVKYVLDQLQPPEPGGRRQGSRPRDFIKPSDWRLSEDRPPRELP